MILGKRKNASINDASSSDRSQEVKGRSGFAHGTFRTSYNFEYPNGRRHSKRGGAEDLQGFGGGVNSWLGEYWGGKGRRKNRKEDQGDQREKTIFP